MGRAEDRLVGREGDPLVGEAEDPLLGRCSSGFRSQGVGVSGEIQRTI